MRQCASALGLCDLTFLAQGESNKETYSFSGAARSMSSLLQPGAIFANDYRVMERLAVGGMGIVYVVENIHVGGRWALKIMHPELVRDPELRSRFAQEARAPARIRSDHIVKVMAAGVTDEHDQPYYIMELLEGLTLAEWIELRGPLSRVDAIQFFKQLFHAISLAHNEKIVHRDLKPANIFMADAQSANSSFNVKVLDFGIAKVIAEAKTARTQVLGSAAWMAPEQTQSNSAIGPQADVWALGLIAFFVLTGHSYWQSVTRQQPYEAILRELLLDPLQWASARAKEYGCAQLLPDGFDAWFRRSVCREQSARFASAGEAWAALSSVLSLSLHSTRTIPLSRNADLASGSVSRPPMLAEAANSFNPEPTRLSLPPPSPQRLPQLRYPSLGTSLWTLGLMGGIGLMMAGVLSAGQPEPWRVSTMAGAAVPPAIVVPTPMSTKPHEHTAPAVVPRELRVGFLHLAPTAGSRWTQAHELGRLEAERELGRDKRMHVSTHVTEASAPEAALKLQAMIDDDHDQVIFTTSAEFEEAVEQVARRNPRVLFASCGTNAKGPNVVSYFGRMYQAKYLAGLLAGRYTLTGRIGYIGAKPVPEVFSNINAFTIGVRKSRPNATVHVRWVNEWSAPSQEDVATRDLIKEGADVITMDTDSPQVVQTVNKLSSPARRLFSIGNNGQNICQEAAPDSCLTSTYWNWGPLYRLILSSVVNGTWAQDLVTRSPWWLELDQEFTRSVFNIQLNGLNPRLVETTVIDSLASKRISIARDKVQGKYQPFVEKVLMTSPNSPPRPVSLVQGHLTDTSLLSMCWYVDGVQDKNAQRVSDLCRELIRM